MSAAAWQKVAFQPTTPPYHNNWVWATTISFPCCSVPGAHCQFNVFYGGLALVSHFVDLKAE